MNPFISRIAAFLLVAFVATPTSAQDKYADFNGINIRYIRLLDALQIQRAHIVGFSLGGSTVAQLLTLHPERFLTATQVAAAGRSPEEANDPRIGIEGAQIAKSCISRSRLHRQAHPN